MTAVAGTGSTRVQLICDGCGVTAETDGGGMHDAEVVYVAVAGVGWTGSPFARGRHRCPRCSAVVPVAPRQQARPATAGSSGRVSVQVLSAAAVVRVTGDVDMDVCDELRSALQSAVAARRQVVVDLTRAGVIDSAGLGALVRARNAARQRAGELILAGPSRFVQTVLRTMRLHTAFRVFSSAEQAVAAAPEVARMRSCPATDTAYPVQ
jgi:anti-sigma B factor antagonist